MLGKIILKVGLLLVLMSYCFSGTAQCLINSELNVIRKELRSTYPEATFCDSLVEYSFGYGLEIVYDTTRISIGCLNSAKVSKYELYFNDITLLSDSIVVKFNVRDSSSYVYYDLFLGFGYKSWQILGDLDIIDKRKTGSLKEQGLPKIIFRRRIKYLEKNDKHYMLIWNYGLTRKQWRELKKLNA